MSKVRIPINPKQVGKVGAYTMYVRNGEQIVRQRQNASNYGESASRTLAQQDRRARWGNLVNVYKALKSWQPKAWESLREGVTDYNAFMGANANTTPIYLTKDMVANGCAVMDNFLVSKGSITPIDGSWDAADQAFTTNIVTSSAVSGTTTIAQLSADIISNNSTFKDGDNIAYIRFEQQLDDRQYPYLQSLYQEFTLNTQNNALLSTLPIFPLIKTDNPNNLFFSMEASAGWISVGAVAIHTRKDNGLKVSTQQMVVVDTSLISRFSSSTARQNAIDSYGVSTEVMLAPGEGGEDGGDALPTYVSMVLSGNGNTAVNSPTFNIKPGRYFINSSPNPWSINDVESQGTIVAVSGTTTNNQFVRLFNIEHAEFEQNGIPSGSFVDIPAGMKNLMFYVRADEGSNIVLSLYPY